MNREEVLKTAFTLISGDREKTHGNAHYQLTHTALLWSAFLPSGGFSAHKVAIMMALMKISRMEHGRYNPDDYVDACGYLAIACEIAGMAS